MVVNVLIDPDYFKKGKRAKVSLRGYNPGMVQSNSTISIISTKDSVRRIQIPALSLKPITGILKTKSYE